MHGRRCGRTLGRAHGHGHGGGRGSPRAPGSLGEGGEAHPWGVRVSMLLPRLFKGKSCEHVSEAVIMFVSMSAKDSCEPRKPGVGVV